MSKTITLEQSYAAAHLLEECQRLYSQVEERTVELSKYLEVDIADVYDAVFNYDTTSRLLDCLKITIAPNIKHAESELEYTAKNGWHKPIQHHQI